MNWRGPRDFARHILAGNTLVLPLTPGRMLSSSAGWMESVLYRQDCWQVELVVLAPFTHVPLHRHLRCDSVDLPIAGSGEVMLPHRTFYYKPEQVQGSLAANLVRVPRGGWHGGTAGPHGAVFLSFQRWEGEPGPITTDWEAKDGHAD